MTDPNPPHEVRRLVEQRAAARAVQDWPLADAIRDRLAAIGWEVQDSTRGTTVRPILGRPSVKPDRDGDLLGDDPAVDASIQLVADEHPNDLRRFLAGFAAHPPAASCELLVVANAPSFELDTLLAEAALPMTPRVIETDERLGWADARTLGLRGSLGQITILLDTSVEPTGDVVGPLLAAFDDPRVGLAGGWGVRSPDGRQFDEAPAGEVDAVEAYCMAIRREALRAVGGFDRRFRFYRNADLDFSFAVRDAGWRAVCTEPLPAVRHEHRGWSSLPDDERDRLSRRNFYHFLDRWRGRRDLLLDAAPDGTDDR